MRCPTATGSTSRDGRTRRVARLRQRCCRGSCRRRRRISPFPQPVSINGGMATIAVGEAKPPRSASRRSASGRRHSLLEAAVRRISGAGLRANAGPGGVAWPWRSPPASRPRSCSACLSSSSSRSSRSTSPQGEGVAMSGGTTGAPSSIARSRRCGEMLRRIVLSWCANRVANGMEPSSNAGPGRNGPGGWR